MSIVGNKVALVGFVPGNKRLRVANLVSQKQVTWNFPNSDDLKHKLSSWQGQSMSLLQSEITLSSDNEPYVLTDQKSGDEYPCTIRKIERFQ